MNNLRMCHCLRSCILFALLSGAFQVTGQATIGRVDEQVLASIGPSGLKVSGPSTYRSRDIINPFRSPTVEIQPFNKRSNSGILCNQIYCNDDGNTAIGIVSGAANYRLSIKGKMISEGVHLSLVPRWPDYVFGSGYPLMSLKTLKQYTREHNHLPGIPAAKSVKRDGIDVVELNALLFEKVEELTLHLIRLNDRLTVIEKIAEKK